ncbi:MAG: hypothetical protein IKN01_05290 [Prevotella sp.]|nr:hypothetical protein [Prevotella sp.]
MEKFNFKRFFRVLYWFLRTNSKQLLMWFAGAATCVFLLQMIVTCMGIVVKTAGGNVNTMGFTPEYYKHALLVVRSVLLVGMSIASLFVLSGVFRQLNKKQKAISFLMLPAANKEKYWVLLVYVTVAWTLCLFFGYVVADVLRMVIIPMFKDLPYVSTLTDPNLFFVVTEGHIVQKITASVYSLISIIWVHSCYIAAGSVFRKNGFAIASAGLLLIVALFENVWIKNFGSLISVKDNTLSVNYLVWVVVFVLLAWTVYNYRLSYRLFKNFQVINNKRTNL